MGLKEDLKALEEEAKKLIEEASDIGKLNDIRVNYLGKKGKIKSILKTLGKLSPEERKEIGQLANRIKDELEEALKEKTELLKKKALEEELRKNRIDITLPPQWIESGSSHPVISTLIEISQIFISMGFSVAEGPEVEKEKYNFDMLNIPPDHPARDMQDTFFLNNGDILRTHTSPVQIRTMLKHKPPIAVIAPGRVYRKDADPTHSPMFHQIEGLLVDRDVTFRDLKGILKIFLESVFGKDTKIRFRPSYFPFTEPSAEVDIGCTVCGGKGCRVCKGTGWLEILGCGMVDPEVFKAVGIDPEEYTGFAFGLGIERIAMLKYRITDIRLLFTGDMRFNQQFKGIR
ncbi:MAG TPA: phenylalanine--tRNA ligase subunit alpha [Persephonella sp.]|uniref:Phenylalanine--tRNA ligase alpha subunit n=1 Tax=Persephonella marina (strain DSM 14350 / EX-H1) TaxID=123214 RepID=SYFA_PERMH|nr:MULTISPECIES: phenylalanine--tRNA ligase subunit alpha [Persephonella]C0QT55.1 RecName: Full=Phenylalanine--tRNA ligase alpha subunit; AltName: Full=Phenylalanyl-tRNA synthetase alpha subunit; Short=PheRS [Persephonella marina EX-H1]ACO04770.1 phenylalanyl-tRNA synthetase, alpha subunit [Persephonella marina EX-H1]HCB70511.1 phenylalanine--tRNA ligase subunit alpha [Persephonella sp.]